MKSDKDNVSKSQQQQQQQPQLERHLSLSDLIAIGIGGTVGSGLFVLAGLVANRYAGPAAVLSWVISGFTALISGCCYAELSGRIPLAGGAYAYNYVAMGELFAFVAAFCLSIQYIAASAAVCRSWGDKLTIWIALHFTNDSHWMNTIFNANSTFNPFALLLSSTTTALLLIGVKESKAVTNYFTIFKVIVVVVMVFGALYYVRPSNWVPFAPNGVTGVLRGATGTFFGYLGYDQVTALGGEAKDAKRNLPIAIVGVLIGVMLLYASATLFLTGMQYYTDISPVSGFPDAFRAVGAHYIAEFVSVGEIVTLPLVVLVTLMAQPRLQYAMAMDGLLPAVFGEIDRHGNLWKGTLIAGSCMTAVSAFVPFGRLNDTISCAVLLVLALTDTSVILLWHEGTESNPNLPGQLMFVYHFLCLVSGATFVHCFHLWFGKVIAILALVAAAFTCYLVFRWCPKASTFGGRGLHYHDDQLCKDEGYFKTPGVPFLPCAAVFVNWYLILQLDLLGIGALLLAIAVAISYYFLYGAFHSVGKNGGWSTPSSSYRSDPDEIELEGNKDDNGDDSDLEFPSKESTFI